MFRFYFLNHLLNKEFLMRTAMAIKQQLAISSRYGCDEQVVLKQTLTLHNKTIRALTTLPDGRLASGDDEGIIKVWDTQKWQCLLSFGGDYGSISCLIAVPDGRLLSVSGSLITVWNTQSGKALQNLKGSDETWANIDALITLPDGRLASSESKGIIKVWDFRKWQCLQTLQGDNKQVRALAVLPNSRLASGSFGGTIKLWDIKTGQCLQTLPGHTDSISALTMLPDGRLASGSSDKTIKLWDIKTGQCLQTLSGHSSYIHDIKVLPEGRLISCSQDSTIKVWDTNTGECLQTLAGHTNNIVQRLAILPDGRLASGSYDKTIKVWEFPFEAAKLKADKLWTEKKYAEAIKIYHALTKQSFQPATETLTKLLKSPTHENCFAFITVYIELSKHEPDNRDYQHALANLYLTLAKLSPVVQQSKLACQEAKQSYLKILRSLPSDNKAAAGLASVEQFTKTLEKQAEERAAEEDALKLKEESIRQKAVAEQCRQLKALEIEKAKVTAEKALESKLKQLRDSWPTANPSQLMKTYELIAKENSDNPQPLVEMGLYRLRIAEKESDRDLKFMCLGKAKELLVRALEIDDFHEEARKAYKKVDEAIHFEIGKANNVRPKP